VTCERRPRGKKKKAPSKRELQGLLGRGPPEDNGPEAERWERGFRSDGRVEMPARVGDGGGDKGGRNVNTEVASTWRKSTAREKGQGEEILQGGGRGKSKDDRELVSY